MIDIKDTKEFDKHIRSAIAEYGCSFPPEIEKYLIQDRINLLDSVIDLTESEIQEIIKEKNCPHKDMEEGKICQTCVTWKASEAQGLMRFKRILLTLKE